MNAYRTITLISALLVHTVFAAIDFSFVSDGPIVPGEWNSNWIDGMNYADEHGIPVMMIYGASDCGNTKSYLLAIQKDDVKAWIKEHPIVLLCTCAYSEELYKIKKAKTAETSLNPDIWSARQWFKKYAPSMDYPIVGLHWLQASGEFNYSYIGRSSQIPRVAGYGYGGLVSELTIRLLDKYFGSYTGEDSSTPAVDPTPTPTPEPEESEEEEEPEIGFWDEAHTYQAVAYDPETADPTALITLTTRKADAVGVVSVVGTVMTSGGKKLSFKSTIDSGNPHLEAKITKLGNIIADLGENGLEDGGKLANWPLIGVNSIGGRLPSDTAKFEICDPATIPDEISGYTIVREALPTNFVFDTESNNWDVPKKGSVKWSADEKKVVVSGENPAKLKLSYTGKSGYFKGEFYIYGYKYRYARKTGAISGCQIKGWKVKVAGLVANGTGCGRAETNALEDPLIVLIECDDEEDEK